MSDKQLIKFMYDYSVIHKSKNCPVCGFDMCLDENSHTSRCIKRVEIVDSHSIKSTVRQMRFAVCRYVICVLDERMKERM